MSKFEEFLKRELEDIDERLTQVEKKKREKLKSSEIPVVRVANLTELDSNVRNVRVVNPPLPIRIPPFPRPLEYVRLKKPEWLPLMFVPLKPIKESIDKVAAKIDNVKLEFPTTADNPIPVRLSNGKEFIESFGQAVQTLIPSGGSVPTVKTSIAGIRGVPIVNPDGSNLTLTAQDIEIGAVEIKDSTTDTRTTVTSNNALLTETKETAPTDSTKTNPSYVLTRDGSGYITSIDMTIGDDTYTKTITRDDDDYITGISAWV